MAALREMLAYLLQRYKNTADLSNARVTKMVYLSDWKQSLERGRQMSPIRWYFDNYGPFVWDVVETAREFPELFRVEQRLTPSGSTKQVLSCVDKGYVPDLSAEERATIDFVIRATEDMPFSDFINLIYSTYPVVKSDRYSFLDLPNLAAEYKDSAFYKSTPAAPARA